jgi:hypothetical protein
MSDVKTDMLGEFRRVAGWGKREAKRLLLDSTYRVERFHQGRYLPPLTDVGRSVVDVLARGEIVVMPVDELDLASTPPMEAAAVEILSAIEDDMRAGEGITGEPLIRMSTNVPELRAWATERAMMAIAGNYIGVPATFQGVHARIERVNPAQLTSEQWHRDLEDRRMLKCFYFPEEVTLEHGPFEYLPDSAVDARTLKAIRHATKEANARGQMGLTDDELARLVDRSLWRTSEIPARSVVFADPIAFYHHGRLRSRPRKSLFFVYTSAFPRHPEYCAQYWNDRYPPA